VLRNRTMTDSEPSATHTDVPATCRMLRAKGAGVVYGEPVRWESGFHPNAVYWCLLTAESMGPDDGPVHPHACGVQRECFRA